MEIKNLKIEMENSLYELNYRVAMLMWEDLWDGRPGREIFPKHNTRGQSDDI